MVGKARASLVSGQLRCFSPSILLLLSQILADEDEANDRTLMYYVNDGVYGSFNCILYDHAHVKPVLQKVCPFRRVVGLSHVMDVEDSLPQQSPWFTAAFLLPELGICPVKPAAG